MIMIYPNSTSIKNFYVIGFPGLLPHQYGLVSALLFIIFIFIIFGNVFILVFVIFERCLHKPTYNIFCQLALTDIAFALITLPRIIARYWWDDKVVAFGACISQVFFVHSLGAITSLILLMMAIDRFIAICIPLRYPALVTNKIISIVCGMFWVLTFLRMSYVLIIFPRLHFCKSNIIRQCYCDFITVVRLSCNTEDYLLTLAIGFAMFSLITPLLFIIFSYFSIIITVLKISQAEGRLKAMSTCTPQIFITSVYYVPRLFAYLAWFCGYKFPTPDQRIAVIMLYSIFPCVVNPIIYCFKTKDIKEALIRRMNCKKMKIDIKAPQ